MSDNLIKQPLPFGTIIFPRQGYLILELINKYGLSSVLIALLVMSASSEFLFEKYLYYFWQN